MTSLRWDIYHGIKNQLSLDLALNQDEYTRPLGCSAEKLQGWNQDGTEVNHIQRKIHHDWKTIYLARTGKQFVH